VNEDTRFIGLFQYITGGLVRIFNKDDAIHGPTEQRLNSGLLLIWIPIRINDQAQKAVFIQVVLYATNNWGSKRTEEVINNNAYCICAICAQTSSSDIWFIAHHLGRTEYLLTD